MNDQPPVQSDRPEPVDAVFVLGIVSLLLVALAWVALGVMGAGRTKQITQFDSKIQVLDGQIKAIAETSDTYGALQGAATHAVKLRENRYLFGPTWTMLKESVPKDVAFTSVTLGTDATVRIVGETKSITTVAQFARELENQTTVTMVTPLSIEKSSNSEGRYGFNLSFKTITPVKGKL